MPEALIVGKGPTFRIPSIEDTRIICALNGAAKLCPRIDWLFVNDVSGIQELDASTMDRVANLVIPSELHLVTNGTKTLPWGKTPNWFRFRPEVHLYRLATAKQVHRDLPFFGSILSVGETCVAWMTEQEGIKDFTCIGIDPHYPRYHSKFRKGRQATWKQAGWYVRNWERMQKRVQDAGGTIKREEDHGRDAT